MNCHHLRHWPWLITAGGVLVWTSLPGELAKAALVPLWVVAWQVIFASSLEIAQLRRRAWLGQYLQTGSSWHRLLQGGVLMVVWHQISSALIALVLMVILRGIQAWDTAILMAGLAGFVWSCSRLLRSVQPHVHPEYQQSLARRMAIPVVAAPLALVLAVTSLLYPQPYLIGIGWSDAAQQHVTSEAGESLLGSLERGALIIETGSLWVIQNSIELLNLANSTAQPLIWLLYFLMQGAMAWAFVRLLAGQAALLQHFRTVPS